MWNVCARVYLPPFLNELIKKKDTERETEKEKERENGIYKERENR